MRALQSLVVAAVLLVVSGPAGADPQNMNQLLKGDYAFTGEAACLVSEGTTGFSPNLEPLGFARSISFMVEGVRTFNGDGTGSVRGRSVSIVHPGRVSPPAPPPSGFRSTVGMPFLSASSNEFEADFTYTVSPDGRTFTADSGPITLTFTSGARNGQTATISAAPGDPIVPLSGRISQDLKTLTAGSREPSVETVHFDGPPPPGPTAADEQRICHRSRVLIKIK